MTAATSFQLVDSIKFLLSPDDRRLAWHFGQGPSLLVVPVVLSGNYLSVRIEGGGGGREERGERGLERVRRRGRGRGGGKGWQRSLCNVLLWLTWRGLVAYWGSDYGDAAAVCKSGPSTHTHTHARALTTVCDLETTTVVSKVTTCLVSKLLQRALDKIADQLDCSLPRWFFSWLQYSVFYREEIFTNLAGFIKRIFEGERLEHDKRLAEINYCKF